MRPYPDKRDAIRLLNELVQANNSVFLSVLSSGKPVTAAAMRRRDRAYDAADQWLKRRGYYDTAAGEADTAS